MMLMPSLLSLVLDLLLIPMIFGLWLIPMTRGLLLILLIIGLLAVLVIGPWFVVSPGQIAPLPAVPTVPAPVTPVPPWTVPEILRLTSSAGDLSFCQVWSG